MRLDFTITVGNMIAAVSICLTLIGTAWAVIRKINQFIFLFREFPPHRHLSSEGIIFPKGMHPEDVRLPRAAAAKQS